MKKIFLLMILTLIFGINNVFAKNIQHWYIGNSNLSNNVIEQSLTNRTTTYTFDITNFTSVNGYDTLEGSIALNYDYANSGISINLSQVNWSTTCANYYSIETNACSSSDCYLTITYADGSTARIQENGFTFTDDLKYFCNQWSTSGGAQSGTFTIPAHDTTPFIDMKLLTEQGQYSLCSVSNTGYFVCQLDNNNRQYRYIRFDVTRRTNYVDTLRLTLNRSTILVGSDATSIINNQNQNTQNIVNNITNDDISGNDSNTAINSIGSTFDTENDFLLGLLTIPYNFFNSLMNIFEDNCTSLNLGTIFEKPLVFPCISLSNLLGNVFTNVIDIIFCGIIMSAFLRRIVKYYQALLSLDERATQIGGVKIW